MPSNPETGWAAKLRDFWNKNDGGLCTAKLQSVLRVPDEVSSLVALLWPNRNDYTFPEPEILIFEIEL